MKRVKQKFAPRLIKPAPHERQGSVIIVVITLLTALMVLGFFAFTRAQQDMQNSDYFAQGSKKIDPLDLNQDLVFDSFLRQLILGAAPTEYNSMFYGGTVSLLPTMFGTDLAPYSGEGPRLTFAAGGAIVVDMDYDGARDPANHHFEHLNHSPMAQGSVQSLVNSSTGHQLPQPDVPYTYPDHTSPFLTYIAYVPTFDATGTRVFPGRRVILPAFHRPQMLRGLGAGNWYTDPLTRTRVLRPHAQHTAFQGDGTPNGLRYSAAFDVPNPNDGHWGGGPLGSQQYDADPSGRGVNDAVYVDIGFPMQTDPVTGEQYVPLVAAVIVDGEGLLNLNIHGNSNKYNYLRPTNITSAVPFGGNNQYLTSSNQGVSRSEVNPGWVMNTDPTSEMVAPNWAEQYEFLFNHAPIDALEASNMDMWNLMHGRPLFGAGSPIPAGPGDIAQLLSGRYGELQRMDNAIASRNSIDFPWPGTTSHDDNGNAQWGNPGSAFQMANVPTFSHPLDVFGIGEAAPYTAANRSRYKYPGRNPLIYPEYRNMATHPQTVWRILFGGGLMPGNLQSQYGDEPDETVAEPVLASLQTNDSIFLPATTAALQLNDADLNAQNIADRALGLASINFRDGARAESIRSMMGTVSSDLKSYSHVYHDPTFAANQEFRTTEFDNPGGNQPLNFPLNTSGAIRPELNELMFMEVTSYRGNDIRKLQRKLSVNGVLDRDPQNNLRFRPLTPHPHPQLNAAGVPVPGTEFGAGRVNYSGIVRPEQITNLNQREFLARRDRQKMARDIYTILYYFGGGDDTTDYTSSDPYNSTTAAGAKMLREMAQFAVNVVDALDTDDVVTKFEYDVDLSDGWNLNDYPFDYSGISPADGATDIGSGSGSEQRGVVYGVEEQSLCLNEALAVIAGEVHEDPMDQNSATEDLAATEWDDQEHHHFLQFELQNVSPRAVRFDQGQWQIVVRPLDGASDTAAGTLIGPERRLEINSATLTVDNASVANSFLTVGTVGNESNLTPTFPAGSFGSLNPGPSRIMINDDTANRKVAPSIAVDSTQYLDLLTDSTEYQVYDDAFPMTPMDNTDDHDATTPLPNTPGTPSGANLLEFTDEESLTVTGTMANPTGPLTDKYVDLILRRRLDPNRARPTDASPAEREDNPWVVVDRLRIPLQQLQCASGDSGAAVDTQVKNLDGSESRYQPLFGDGTNSATTPSLANPGNNNYTNTLGERNRVGGTVDYTLWQPHFNRDYASLAELLNIPLYGMDRLTNYNQAPYPNTWNFPTVKLGETSGTGENAELSEVQTFGFRVFNPNPTPFLPPVVPPASPPGTNDDTRWNRVLNFLEVPRRQAVTGFGEKIGYLQNPVTGRFEDGHQDAVYRNHGPLNLNTIRNPEVYAAMLDEERVMRLQNAVNPLGDEYLQDNLVDRLVEEGSVANAPENHDWWGNFLASRDGFDPLPTPAENYNVIVPGIPGVSRPFQPLSFNDFGPYSFEQTILRRLVPGASTDPMEADQRQLFELGNEADHTNHTIDYAEKYRLLGKTMNHSTLTSNTFYIFLQVDYFEATDMGSGAVQIGAKLASSPGYRGFFVVDRAKALNMVTPSDLPPTQDPYTGAQLFSFNQNFDWRSLVLYRRRLN